MGLFMIFFCLLKLFGLNQNFSQKHVHYIQNYGKVWNQFGKNRIKVQIFLEGHNNLKKSPNFFELTKLRGLLRISEL